MNNEPFNYTYSSSSQKEIEQIKQKYEKPQKTIQEEKYEKLKELDSKVYKRCSIFALTEGIISLLVFGLGLSMALLCTTFLIVSIFIGIIGLIGMLFAYPIYNIVLEKDKEKYSKEIIDLCNELLI